MELHLLSKARAGEDPVGEAQREPNRNPYLPPPMRNPPPWAIGSNALSGLKDQYMKYLCRGAIATVILIGLAVLFLYLYSIIV